MSAVRGFFPAAIAIAVGVVTGYYTFQPAFQQLEAEKRTQLHRQQNPSERNMIEVRGPAKDIPTSSSSSTPSGLPPQTIQDPNATPAVTWTQRLWPFHKPARTNAVPSTVAESTRSDQSLSDRSSDQ
ncbi:hypothetical protein DTO271D3_6227 [Paecilomyces variotii]|nr:hypothetical protein DTO169C6_2961 [Paecilomyces variotii]KAJ9308134.1 hypothetical protein DTO217A2_2375 [Paecilomyces variotii]KAJ9313550.1 hypothetical protein DTO271D3_6227 [Paecilomyces variotii]KAJ9409742.1 hypothetical protein DTO045G8_2668 [Paecilomyces variotii]